MHAGPPDHASRRRSAAGRRSAPSAQARSRSPRRRFRPAPAATSPAASSAIAGGQRLITTSLPRRARARCRRREAGCALPGSLAPSLARPQHPALHRGADESAHLARNRSPTRVTDRFSQSWVAVLLESPSSEGLEKAVRAMSIRALRPAHTHPMAANRRNLRLLLAASAVAALAFAAPAHGALTAPGPSRSRQRRFGRDPPAFAWSPVPGADLYEFQVAADQNFNSPVLGRGEGSFSTTNTRATLKKTLPNGRYWWRVRATTNSGDASPWSTPRSLTKAWTALPSTRSPAPATRSPSRSRRSRSAGRPSPSPPATSSHSPATRRSRTSSSTTASRSRPGRRTTCRPSPSFRRAPTTGASSRSTPRGTRGPPSPVNSFYWSWPSTTTTYVTDLMTAPEMFDPQFSWTPVPGATKYEVEVNSSVDFAPGSKVCCSQLTTSTSLAPTVVFRDNTYYWRVRALDAAGNAGVWNRGPDFVKTFDKVPPVDPPSIKNLHIRDNLADPGTDVEPGTAGYQTRSRSSSGTRCRVPRATSSMSRSTAAASATWGGPGSWRVNTSIPSWAPLGYGWNSIKPYPDPMAVAYDGRSSCSTSPTARVCVRVASATSSTRRSTATSRTSTTARVLLSSGRATRPATRAARHAALATSARTTTCFPPAGR